MVGLADIRAAAARLKGQIERTPFLHSRTLSEITGAEVWLKFENLQYTASFKERGAYNRLVQLSPEQRAGGVAAMSAGNHAQGVAYHARRLGVRAVIVMPAITPFVKIESTRKLGAEVVLQGESLEDATTYVNALVAEKGLTFIHPFDDPEIIAGQGTAALEMLEDVPDLDAVVVPIGGGGLVSGIAIAAKATRPALEVIGVEAALFPSVERRLRGEPVGPGGPTIAEGIAVKHPSALTMSIIERLVDDVVLVDEPEIEAAVLQLLEIEKTVVEGAGAVALAALRSYPDRFRGRRVGLVLSGGNIDSRLLSGVILRGLVRTERLVRFRITVPDSPGSLARLAIAIADQGGNVVDVAHQRAFARRSVKQTDIDVTIETRNAAHALEIAGTLTERGFQVVKLDEDAATEL
jgi:threonine dehydratase